MTRRMVAWMAVVAVGVAFSGLTTAARAADAKVTGTWKWETTRQNGDKVEVTLKLEAKGDKLTGTITGPGGNENEIKDGTVKGGDVAFNVEREFNGNKFVMKYTAKVDGDTIKGKSEVERDGNVRTREFEGKRAS
jgi:hypothetical protein